MDEENQRDHGSQIDRAFQHQTSFGFRPKLREYPKGTAEESICGLKLLFELPCPSENPERL